MCAVLPFKLGTKTVTAHIHKCWTLTTDLKTAVRGSTFNDP